MSAPKTALARLGDRAPRQMSPREPLPPREPVRGGGGGGGFGSLTPERARVLMLVAARPAAIVLLVIFVLVFGTLFAAHSGTSGASGAIAASWLAVHQVPLVIGKTGIGLWPLVPTAVMLWLVARECDLAAEPGCTRVDLAWIVGAAVGGPLLITAVCLAVADDASATMPLQPPQTLVAFAWVIGLNLVAAIAGIGARNWREFTDLLPIPLPHWVVPGVRTGLLSVWRLLLVAAAVTVVSFLGHWSRIGDTYHTAGNIFGGLGLTVLSLAYLPNVLIDAVGLLLGGQVHIGAGSLSLFGIEGAPLPAVPLAAAVPSGPVAAWWMALLVAPAAVGVLGGLDCGRTSRDRPAAPWATLTSAAVAAVAITLLGVVAGGELGTFGRIGPNLLLSAALAFIWLAVAGYVGMLGARWFTPAGAATAAAAGYAGTVADDEYDDYDLEYEDDYDPAYESDYEDPDADYDEYDDYDEEFDDDYADDYEPAPAADDTVDGELLEEDEPVFTARIRQEPAAPDDIVDAEIVEGTEVDN
ncbi:DUF6350 family protein [Nocardia sp. NPDC020380]|uniref:cell division protein PerM n=1 Tax=Nocardia sp. NPDC020380 TaxID=3364309 RepID=UPI0037B3B22A